MDRLRKRNWRIRLRILELVFGDKFGISLLGIFGLRFVIRLDWVDSYSKEFLSGLLSGGYSTRFLLP